jgi:hypothetical protein
MDARLVQLCDEMNEIFRKVEALLIDRHPGVRAQVDLPDDMVLIFGKHHQAWGLFVVKKGRSDLMAVVNASRLVRVQAMHALVALEEALTESAATHFADTSRAVDMGRAFLTSVRS